MAIAINNMSRATEDAHSMKSYYVLAKSLNGFDLTDGDGEKIERYQYIPSGIVQCFTGSQSEETNMDGENDALPFTDSYNMCISSTEDYIYDFDKMNVQGERISDNNGTNVNWCYKITGNGDFKYSNYTVPSDINSYDISYSQFWNRRINKLIEAVPEYVETSIYPHYLLYNNNAGDFSFNGNNINNRKSRMIYGRYHKSNSISSIIDTYGEQYTTLYSSANAECNMKTLDGRIIAAFPLNLLLKTDEDVLNDLYNNQMHIFRNYKDWSSTDGGLKNNGDTQNINNVAYNNKQYKLVDVVMQSTNGYQYVIPFTVVDVKWIHHKPSSQHYAMAVDNTYGHVYNGLNNDGNLSYLYMNPIEPYLQVKKDNIEYNGNTGDIIDNTMINNKLYEIIFGDSNTKDKIVSMRIYDKTFDKNNITWWKNIEQHMSIKNVNQIINDVSPFYTGGCSIVNYIN